MELQAELEELQPVVMNLFKRSKRENRLSHGYLFHGPNGVGKKRLALWLAQSLFCLEQTDEVQVCSHCVNCTRIANDNHPDVHWLEPDGASIKIDQVREIRSELMKQGMESNQKVLIIDEADKMTVQSANSLLKFIEEPEAGTLLLFLTTNPAKILPTIASRLQPVAFRELPFEQLVKKLEQVGISQQKARIFASLTGSVQEAERLNEDEFFQEARNASVKLYEGLHHDGPEPLIFIQETWMPLFKDKAALAVGLDLLLLLYRDVFHLMLGENYEPISAGQAELLKRDALRFSLPAITQDIETVLEAKRKLDSNMNQQLLMEELVLKLKGGHLFA